MDSLILASSSPRRKELLAGVGVPFRVVPSEMDEDITVLKGSPGEKAERLALGKALDVAERTDSGLVLGADTIVVLDGRIYGKPLDREDAYEMLSNLNGKMHQVITGVALVDAKTGKHKVSHETTEVFFRKLSDDKILSYLDTGEYQGKAGAYAIQGIGAVLVEGIKGCYSNVVGLPLSLVDKLLEEFGLRLL